MVKKKKCSNSKMQVTQWKTDTISIRISQEVKSRLVCLGLTEYYVLMKLKYLDMYWIRVSSQIDSDYISIIGNLLIYFELTFHFCGPA